MPRLTRIDYPGALHHVMARGIERRAIFRDDADDLAFGEYLGNALTRSGTPCDAWAFLPNHVHLPLVTGKRPLHQVLHLALTWYAGHFNRRHRRVGHLLQNRDTSILCERDAYFPELVRYIHLNPVRARLLETPAELARDPWCGHGVLLDRVLPGALRSGRASGRSGRARGGWAAYAGAGAAASRASRVAA
jgi:REP element-mobilizing transposase RayT